jgi:hypothetical protein
MKKLHILSLLLITTILFQACRPDNNLPIESKATQLYDAQIARDWFEMFRLLTRKNAGFSPPVASRAFGYAGLTLYETVVQGMPRYQSLAGQLTSLESLPQPGAGFEYDWAIAANSAMAFVAKNYYANMTSQYATTVDSLYRATRDRLRQNITNEVVDRSEAYGENVARAIFEWSKQDGGHEGYNKNFPTSFNAPVGAGLWTPFGSQKPLQPYWGNNRTFVPNCAAVTQPIFDIRFSSSASSLFYNQANEVYLTVKNITAEQTIIAKYWSDDAGEPGTPPGHSVSILTQVLRTEGMRLDRAAEAYAKVGMALSDAFVSCWKCKYDHNLERPVTYIRRYIDSNFTTILSTPPFAEYTSGHSVQAGASARILSEIFGYNYAFIDETHKNRTDINGSPRRFSSFNQMATEAGISRLYGGIHFREAIDDGVAQGTQVGAEIAKLKFRK